MDARDRYKGTMILTPNGLKGTIERYYSDDGELSVRMENGRALRIKITMNDCPCDGSCEGNCGGN